MTESVEAPRGLVAFEVPGFEGPDGERYDTARGYGYRVGTDPEGDGSGYPYVVAGSGPESDVFVVRNRWDEPERQYGGCGVEEALLTAYTGMVPGGLNLSDGRCADHAVMCRMARALSESEDPDDERLTVAGTGAVVLRTADGGIEIRRGADGGLLLVPIRYGAAGVERLAPVPAPDGLRDYNLDDFRELVRTAGEYRPAE